jgi:hypothetical protein
VAGELYAGEGIAPTSRSSREQAWGGPWRRLGRAAEGRRWAKEQRMWRLLSHRLSSQLEARRYVEKMRCGQKKFTRIQFDRKKKLLKTMAGRVHVLLD